MTVNHYVNRQIHLKRTERPLRRGTSRAEGSIRVRGPHKINMVKSGLSRGKRGPQPTSLAKLYRLKYIQGITDKRELAEKLQVKPITVYSYEKRLQRKLAKKIRQISPDRLDFVCPQCLEARVYDDPETGERVCTACGTVLESGSDMVHRLPFDQTYALENPLAFNKSLGTSETLRSHYGYSKVLVRTRNIKGKAESIAGIVEDYRSGKLSPIEAAEEIRRILIRGGAEEIAEALAESRDKPPLEAARRIVNMFDAIPIHQIMTLHEVHEPPLIRKMKEYGNGLREETGLSRPNPICDPDIFSAALGNAIEKVGREALSNPDYRHRPKDLAAACFLKVAESMNPDVVFHNINPPPDVLLYVDLILENKQAMKEVSKRVRREPIQPAKKR